MTLPLTFASPPQRMLSWTSASSARKTAGRLTARLLAFEGPKRSSREA